MDRTVVLLVAAMSLSWHGVLLSAPHTHADATVSQEKLVCSASRPTSQTNHLLSAGHWVLPHSCLACLAGSTVANSLDLAKVEEAAGGESINVAASSDLRSRFQARLPLVRGPPTLT